MAEALAPLLTERDEAESAEGGIDPLGLYTIADTLGVRLVPGVRERQTHPRFLTAIAASLAVCGDLGDEAIASDGVSEPWQVFEWYAVEGLARTSRPSETVGLPGGQKAASAIADGVPMSAKRYLKTPSVFGFHGIYRLLARTLGIEQGGRLGDVGFELLNVWSKERELEGFVGTAVGPGQAVKRQLREAVEAGLEKGGTARSGGWSGWEFFRQHLGLYNVGQREAEFIATKLRADNKGYRGRVLDFLISTSGRKLWDQEQSERDLHSGLRKGSKDELSQLLAAIDSYERFARLCQDAFDDCLCEMTRKRGKTSPLELGRLRAVKLAREQVPEIFSDVMERLEPFGQSARLQDMFGDLTERCAADEWATRLIEHHRRIQRLKPPDGKNSWIERFDDGRFMVRPLYRRDEPARRDAGYQHAYRTHSLRSFARDLGLISR
jgi:hypothetical protein